MLGLILELIDRLHQKDYRIALDLALQLHAKMPNNPYLLRLISTLYGILAREATGGEGWALEEEAIRWGEQAVHAAPEIGWLWAELGWDCWVHLEYERAHRAFRRALELDPCCVDALRGLASLWSLPENEGEKWVSRDEMIDFLKRVVELEYRNPIPALHWLVNELQRAGQHEQAKAYALRALLSFPPPEPEMSKFFAKLLSDGRIEADLGLEVEIL
ncbi:tetratricopeptide repeat protein [Thermoflexus hugenholtzii]